MGDTKNVGVIGNDGMYVAPVAYDEACHEDDGQ